MQFMIIKLNPLLFFVNFSVRDMIFLENRRTKIPDVIKKIKNSFSKIEVYFLLFCFFVCLFLFAFAAANKFFGFICLFIEILVVVFVVFYE